MLMMTLDRSKFGDARVCLLYPIVNVQQFSSDFIKKVGSGKAVGLDAEAIPYSRYPFDEFSRPQTQADFWGNPRSGKDSTSQNTVKKKDKSFWDQ